MPTATRGRSKMDTTKLPKWVQERLAGLQTALEREQARVRRLEQQLEREQERNEALLDALARGAKNGSRYCAAILEKL